MLILPVLMDSSRREPERCPHCGKILPASEANFKYFIWVLGFVLALLWAGITLLEWMFGFREQTLVEILRAQGEWFINLLGRIW